MSLTPEIHVCNLREKLYFFYGLCYKQRHAISRNIMLDIKPYVKPTKDIFNIYTEKAPTSNLPLKGF